MFKSLSIFKLKPSENPKAPTHKITAKIGEEFVTIGSLWTKENTYGKYLSGTLQNAWVDHADRTKTRDGFVIISEKELNKLENELKLLKGEALEEDLPEEERLSDESKPPVF